VPVTITVLAPVRDEGPHFAEHLNACLAAVPGLDVEVVLLDNQSVDGCCQGMPREVLIVRTERVESPARLWRLGRELATGESLLWLPKLSSLGPGRFRGLVLAAEELRKREAGDDSGRGPRRLRFAAARKRPAFLTPRARSRLDRWGLIPVLGRMLSVVTARHLCLLIPLGQDEVEAEGETVIGGEAAPEPALVKMPVRRGSRPLSVILTVHNEGDEVLRTVESVRANTRSDHEIIVVDDGSTDGSCSGLEALGVRVIRHAERVGVAYSRDEGSRAAEGDVFAYLDAHQRIEPGCLDRCLEVAEGFGAIVCPPCRPLRCRYPTGYGAFFRLCPERGFFSARSQAERPRREVTRISALRSPGYVIPRSVYRRVAWISGLRGWGATDFSLALKAFFADVDILHVNAGATRHLFRRRIPYETNWEGVWRNHALIARVCFDDDTWSRYWLPEVFGGHLSDETRHELDSPAVIAERDGFQADKVRPDREFWRGLLHVAEPDALR
jgi:glycosyltransferase involved in cell wall biosynthesis